MRNSYMMVQKLDTRTRIIKAASLLFRERGIHWVSFQMIASEVGISQAAIYKHFEDKDDLLKACALSAAQSGRVIVDGFIDETSSAKKQLRGYIEGNFAWLSKEPTQAVMVLALYYFGINSKPLGELMVTIHDQTVQRLMIRLEMGNREKSWSIKATENTARLIHNLLIGEMIKTLHSPSQIPKAKRVDLVWKGALALIENG